MQSVKVKFPKTQLLLILPASSDKYCCWVAPYPVINHFTSLNLLCNLLGAEQMGRSRQAAAPRAGECKSEQSNKLVGLCSFFPARVLKPLVAMQSSPGQTLNSQRLWEKLVFVVQASRSRRYGTLLCLSGKWWKTVLARQSTFAFSDSHFFYFIYLFTRLLCAIERKWSIIHVNDHRHDGGSSISTVTGYRILYCRNSPGLLG